MDESDEQPATDEERVTMRRRRAAVLFTISVAASLAMPGASRADGWTAARAPGGEPRVFYGEGDDRAAMMLTCENVAAGEIALVFGGIDAGLSTDTDYPAAVSVDGLAFVVRGRLRANAGRGDNDLVHVAPAAEAMSLVEALKAGSGAEVSTPAGRYRLPLKGSGRALAALDGGCG